MYLFSIGTSVLNFWNENKSHLPSLYKIQESHLIIQQHRQDWARI